MWGRLKMGFNDFIKKNREFWKGNINENCDKKLLIEEAEIPCIIHDLAIHTILLNKAKSYQPIWYPNSNVSLDLLKSYIPLAEKAKTPKLNIFENISVFINSLIQFLKIIINRDILSVKHDGVKYGDIVYDVYLAQEQVGTIEKIDSKIYELIRQCIKRHILIIKILKNNNISGVLVSHRIGIVAGVMLRAALRYGCEVYSLAGMHRATLYKSKDLKQMIEYEYTPKNEDINKLLALSDTEFEKGYDFVRNFHMYGNCSMDAKFAYSDDNNFYNDRQLFAKDFKLDPDKKNIFIMMHAFTDYPHTHFKWMLFKDYGDWFLKTLEYAKKDKSVNWIFKQHPADHFYPTKDIDYDKLFGKVPDNIVFLNYKNKLDTRSLVHVADAVITCLGSAGFELPAIGGVPSITAGDNFYNDLGFSTAPKTKKEYFNILSNLKNIQKLSADERRRAQAAYMFIYYFCTVDFNSLPILAMDEHHKPNMNEWYWDKVLELYIKNKDLILKQIEEYSIEIKREDFKALRSTVLELKEKGHI